MKAPIALTLLVLTGAAPALGQALPAPTPQPASSAGTATLPLQDLMPLLNAPAPVRPEPHPPIAAVVTRRSLQGRLTPDGLQLKVHVDVEVLEDQAWTTVQLLELGPDATVTDVPHVEGGSVATQGGALLLVTRHGGSYALDLGIRAGARIAGKRHTASLLASTDGATSPLSVELDPAAFRLLGNWPVSSGAAQIEPRRGRWTVEWEEAGPVRAAATQVARPPMEPAIDRVSATWVSTLEGKATVRVKYALKLDRPQKLQLDIPEGQSISRVAVNGVPIDVDRASRHLECEVGPASVGTTEGELEVVMAQDLGVFHLSGRLHLSLPGASWPIAEVAAEAHLPAVFNYRREGGSLEDAPAASPMGGDPLPGKVLHFRQYLVTATSPELDLGYSVDISQSYFK